MGLLGGSAATQQQANFVKPILNLTTFVQTPNWEISKRNWIFRLTPLSIRSAKLFGIKANK